MEIILVFLFLQLSSNIFLDATGALKKYLDSNGAFLVFIFAGAWTFFSLFISFDFFSDAFPEQFWLLVFIPEWLFVILAGILGIIIIQLLYSFVIRKFLFKSKR